MIFLFIVGGEAIAARFVGLARSRAGPVGSYPAGYGVWSGWLQQVVGVAAPSAAPFRLYPSEDAGYEFISGISLSLEPIKVEGERALRVEISTVRLSENFGKEKEGKGTEICLRMPISLQPPFESPPFGELGIRRGRNPAGSSRKGSRKTLEKMSRMQWT